MNSSFLVFALGLLASPALAGTTCSIEINSLLYHYGECTFSKTLSTNRTWSIQIGQKTEGDTLGYWVLLLENPDGIYEGHWNGAYGVSRAHNYLHEVEKIDNCWVGETSRICLDVPFGDVPNYTINREGQTPANNTLEANINGARYVIQSESWAGLFPQKIGPTEDLDGDGQPETIIELSHGGNGSSGQLAVVSYREDGFFHIVNEQPVPNGWGGYRLVEHGEETVIRVYDSAQGVGNVEEWESQTDYALRDGELVKLIEMFNSAKPVTVMELTAKEVREAPGQTKSLQFDLNLDGELDTVTCSYWERWGSLSCEIQHGGSDQASTRTCKRFGITNRVVEDLVVLVCD